MEECGEGESETDSDGGEWRKRQIKREGKQKVTERQRFRELENCKKTKQKLNKNWGLEQV